MTTKHKWLAAWLALLLGGFGAHRLYLHGWRDMWAWLHWPPTLAGIAGVARTLNLGMDDKLAWALIPLGGFSLALAMLGGIVYGLMPDEKWNARFNANKAATQGGWGAVLGVVACLLIGGGITMASFAFSFQRYFEWQYELEKQALPALKVP